MPRPRTYDRDEALRDAVEAFRSSGYAATSVRALQQATGMGPTSLYAEFGGKDALFAAAVDRYVDESRAWLESSLGGDEAGLEPLRRHFASYAFDERASEGCLLVNSLGERSEIPGAARERIDAFFAWVRDRYQVHLEAAAARGQIPASADAAALAAALLAFDQGLASAATIPAQRRTLGAAVAAWFDALEARAA